MFQKKKVENKTLEKHGLGKFFFLIFLIFKNLSKKKKKKLRFFIV